MKDTLSLIFFVVFVFSLASCQPQGEDDTVDASKDSTFTLNGAGE